MINKAITKNAVVKTSTSESNVLGRTATPAPAEKHVQLCVDSSPANVPGGVIYYEARDLPALLEEKKRGDILSIIPVQMLKVQYKSGTPQATHVQELSKAAKGWDQKKMIKV